jgi:hypothetical protein
MASQQLIKNAFRKRCEQAEQLIGLAMNMKKLADGFVMAILLAMPTLTLAQTGQLNVVGDSWKTEVQEYGRPEPTIRT